MGPQKSKLTDWPDNLKDVIDWYLRTGEMDKGGNGISNKTKLKEAVKSVDGFTTATSDLGNFQVEGVAGLFNSVAGALQHLIGYNRNGNHDLTGEGIGRNQSSPYTSSYTAKATWNGQLDTPGSTEANTVASIFLGSMPMVYYFVTYLYWRCSNNKNGGWDTAELTNSHSGLNSFMINMDFPSEQLNGSMSGSQIVKLMTDFHYGFDGLNGVDKSGNSYEKFLGNLHKQHGESKINSAMDCPVYTLYRAAKAYLKYKFEEPKADENEENIRDIKKMFQNFTAACKSAYELKDEFAKFLTDINANITVSSETTNDNSSPSPAAPVAGTLSTLGLGGGAAAAYILDIGGAKTLINGLLRIG